MSVASVTSSSHSTSTTAPTEPARKRERVAAIDGVRALAAIMVFAYHASQFSGTKDQPISRIISLGPLQFDLWAPFHLATAVDLFVVLSGFCLFLPLAKSQKNLDRWKARDHFIRRFRRIAIPSYVAMAYATILPMILVALFHVLGKQANWQPVPEWWQFVVHALFIHTLFVSTWKGITGAFWTLGLEAHFYLLFPLVVWGYRRWGTRVFGAIFAVAILFRLVYAWKFSGPYDPEVRMLWKLFVLSYGFQFGFGMLGSYLVARCWQENRRLTSLQGTGILIGAVLLHWVAIDKTVREFPYFPCQGFLLGVAFSSLLVACLCSDTPLRKIVDNRYMAGFGFFSYSFYLIHQPTAFYISEFIEKIAHRQGEGEFLFMMTGGLAIVIGLAYIYFLCVERPCLNAANPARKLKPSEETPQNIDMADRAVPS